MLKRMMTNSAIYALGDIAIRFSGLLLIPLYTRYLTPEDYGLLSISNTVTAILTIVMMLSLMAAFTRFYFDRPNHAERQSLFSTLLYMVMGWGSVLAMLLLFFGESLLKPWITTPFRPYLSLAVGIALAGLVPQMLLATFQVQEQAKAYVAFTLVTFLCTTSGVIYGVVVLQKGAVGSLEGTFVGTILMALLALLLLKRSWLIRRWQGDVVKPALRYSLPLVPHLLLVWVMIGSDLFILQYYRPMSEVGIYSLGYTLGFAFFVVTGALSRAWSPIYYRYADDPKQQRELSRVVTTMVGLMLVVVSCSLLFLKEAVALITVEAFYAIALIIPWVGLAALFHVIYISYVNMLFYDKRNSWVAMASAGAALTNIGLNIMLVPEYGMQAAAITTALAYLLQMGVVAGLASRLRVLPKLSSKLLYVLSACVALSLCGYGVDQWHLQWFGAVIKLGLMLALLGALYYGGVGRWLDVKLLIRHQEA